MDILEHSPGCERTVLDPYRRSTYWIMPLYLVCLAAWYVIFPDSLFWTRAFTLAWVPVALLALFVFLSRFTGNRRAAALGVVFFGLSYSFIENAGFARPDLMCRALGLLGLAAYVYYRDRSLMLALALSNSFIAASLFTHPNGISISRVIGCRALARRPEVNFESRRLIGRAISCGCGLWSIYIAQTRRPCRSVGSQREHRPNSQDLESRDHRQE